jgi:hypothetical protein
MLTKIIQLSFSCSYIVSPFSHILIYFIFDHGMTLNHLSCRFARRIIANNPTRDNTIPNPGAAGVPAGVTVVTSVVTVSTGVSVGAGGIVSVTVGTSVVAGVVVSVGARSGVAVDENGDPIAVRAAPGLALWLGWFSNNVP